MKFNSVFTLADHTQAMKHVSDSQGALLYKTAKPIPEATRRRLRAFGYVILLIATMALLWDATHLMNQMAGSKLSGIKDFWLALDRDSYALFQTSITRKSGETIWSFLVSPLFSTPICLMFGIPGFILTRRYCPEIKVHAPDEVDQNIESMGLARRRRR